MPIRVCCQKNSRLPKLSWVARLNIDSGELTVEHGLAVECHRDWIVEGIWDGEFTEGNFHECENLFGSGIRVVGDQVYFVPSTALVDRIVYGLDQGILTASNSLVLLLSVTGARLIDDHNYSKEYFSILKGIRNYTRELPVRHPSIQCFYQQFHQNLVVKRGALREELRTRRHSFRNFGDYDRALKGVLSRLHDNWKCPARSVPLTAYTTTSSGYDSPAVSVLVKDQVELTFSSRKSNSMIPAWINRQAAIDDGTPIADVVGLRTVQLSSKRATADDHELFYLAALPGETCLAFRPLCQYIETNCASAVLFTGFHGDKVWDRDPGPKYLNDDLIRGDISGLELTEIRLVSGFINAAIPFVFARDIEDLVAISNSEEMAPWRLGNAYDRPIPRRIVESEGVVRTRFGMRKKAILTTHWLALSRPLQRKYLAYLHDRLGMSPLAIRATIALNDVSYFIKRLGMYVRRFGRGRAHLTKTAGFLASPKMYLPPTRYVWASSELCRQLSHIPVFEASDDQPAVRLSTGPAHQS
jgi:hypothetical protein